MKPANYLHISVISIVMLFPLKLMASAGWTDYAEVIEIVPTIHQRFRVKIDVSDNDSGCKEKQWFYQDYDISGSREMFLTLLEAAKTGIKVRVYVTGRCDINNYSEISSVSLRRRPAEE